MPPEFHSVTSEFSFVIDKKNVTEYWNTTSNSDPEKRDRTFVGHRVAFDWPKIYNNPCKLSLNYNRAVKFATRKSNARFGTVQGRCCICEAIHRYHIDEIPFEETLDKGKVTFKVFNDMNIQATVSGFFAKLADGNPDLSKPYHQSDKADCLQLRGSERINLGRIASKMGTQSAYHSQFANLKNVESEGYNTTPWRNPEVIRKARDEQEKLLRAGDTFYESLRSTYLSQKKDLSPYFPENNATKALPGNIRLMQEFPLKVITGNYDQLMEGVVYLKKCDEDTTIHLDSSGKFFQAGNKIGQKILNSALVMGPTAKGQCPFPICEQISESNKTVDFLHFLQQAWQYMSLANNGTNVPYPETFVTDFSFPNLHSAIKFFNGLSLSAYLQKSFNYLVKKEEHNFKTNISMCENHTLPTLLKTARGKTSKLVGDTLVCGLLKVFQSKILESAMKLWENLCLIHCSFHITEEIKQSIGKVEYDEESYFNDFITEFENNEDDLEAGIYGKRKTLRSQSPFYHLFISSVKKIKEAQNEEEKPSNPFLCMELIECITINYLSLFPFLSASMLQGANKTNARVELWWKEERKIFKNIPKRNLWPTIYFTELNIEIRNRAAALRNQRVAPSVKLGKTRKNKIVDDSRQNFFLPTEPKKKKYDTPQRLNENFTTAKEQWQSKKTSTPIKKDTKFKGKNLDYAFISAVYFDEVRRIENEDHSSCWLSSCIQLILCSFDFIPPNISQMRSELGAELMYLWRQKQFPLNPRKVKEILSNADQINCSQRKENAQMTAKDVRHRDIQHENIENLRLNLREGQQCARDFFICLQECSEFWPDVFEYLSCVTLPHSTCSNCGNVSLSEQPKQICHYLDAPFSDTDMKKMVDEVFNKGECRSNYTCQICKKKVDVCHKIQVKHCSSQNFLIFIIGRRQGRRYINNNKISVIQSIEIMDEKQESISYSPICVIEHISYGKESGHYKADVKNKTLNSWFRTSDNAIPKQIENEEITKEGYIFLYKRDNQLF